MPRLKAERNIAILNMLAKGLTQVEVGRHFKVTKSAVAAIKKRAKDGYRDPRWKDATEKSAQAAVSFERPAPTFPTADEIAAYIARHGVKKCPTVALTPTQAVLAPNPQLRPKKDSNTGWPASSRPKRHGKGGVSSMKSCRIGAVI